MFRVQFQEHDHMDIKVWCYYYIWKHKFRSLFLFVILQIVYPYKNLEAMRICVRGSLIRLWILHVGSYSGSRFLQ